MKNVVTKLSLIALIFASVGCQKQADLGSGSWTEEEQTGTTIVNNLCSDGSLDCVITDNPYTNTASILDQLYQQCYDGCMEEAGATANSCQNLCDDINDTPEDTWASDELRIPDNAKAIEVEIKLCIDPQVHNTIVMQGPTVSVPHYRTTYSQMMGSPIGSGARGNPAGQNLKCKVEGLYNRTKVTFKPVTSSSITIKDVPHTVVPFKYSEEISKTYKSTTVAPFGIPKTLRDELNMEQHAWVASKATTILNAPVAVKFQYLNNDLGAGTSLLHIIPPMHWAPMTFKFVFFAEAK